MNNVHIHHRWKLIFGSLMFVNSFFGTIWPIFTGEIFVPEGWFAVAVFVFALATLVCSIYVVGIYARVAFLRIFKPETARYLRMFNVTLWVAGSFFVVPLVTLMLLAAVGGELVDMLMELPLILISLMLIAGPAGLVCLAFVPSHALSNAGKMRSSTTTAQVFE
jgi:hypothetical protein